MDGEGEREMEGSEVVGWIITPCLEGADRQTVSSGWYHGLRACSGLLDRQQNRHPRGHRPSAIHEAAVLQCCSAAAALMLPPAVSDRSTMCFLFSPVVAFFRPSSHDRGQEPITRRSFNLSLVKYLFVLQTHDTVTRSPLPPVGCHLRTPAGSEACLTSPASPPMLSCRLNAFISRES
ncbi:hypothetical protein BO70DRAFT_357997 [Aspergillus heteromorphus CBS 117.55]|uniref:Uncharacterized protein n=1 Tax=Aspergillus heteromorphus CBS 117.55 TaxID=1448321 RepID=A0A317X8J1_9EURO|nr:uncharacterized protein BO70DRAFT_357997 [Aspergillus heteromorphus CBS 117.55]PWY92880.1 hypothetical protein BO70DRAFT_357997 [Aspergillus heteromorphus CBS 117.55]